MEGTLVWIGQGYEGDKGMEVDKGMWGHGYGRDKCEKVTWV